MFYIKKYHYLALFLLSLNINCDTFYPLNLVPGELSIPIEFELPAEGEVIAHFQLWSDSDWSENSKEAAVLTIYLDGSKNQDLVTFGGQKDFIYKQLLGPVSTGAHQLQIYFDEKKSSPLVDKIKIKNIAFTPIFQSHPDYDVVRFSPVLWGRGDNAMSDTPLLMYHEQFSQQTNTVIEYSLIWSNEDGGTNSIELMSRWGRTTDIELIYRIYLNQEGTILREEYHGEGHDTLSFQGKKIKNHPLLRTATLNNVMSDSGESEFMFFLSPEEQKDTKYSREIIMDENPWIYEIMTKEMQRENKYEIPAHPLTPKVSDARNYLYIEFLSQMSGEEPRLTCGIKLLDDSTWYYSDHKIQEIDVVNRSGWRRTTIELPEYTTTQKLEKLKLMGNAKNDFSIQVLEISRLFFLSKEFKIKPIRLDFDQRILLHRNQQFFNIDLNKMEIKK